MNWVRVPGKPRDWTPRFTLTEDESVLLTEICNDFWNEFGQPVAKTLDRNKIPELESLLLMKLQEHASVYGSDFDRYRQ